MEVIKFDEAPEYHAPEQKARRARILASPIDGLKTENVAVGMAIYGTGVEAPWHAHEQEETIIVIHGKGKFSTRTEEVEATTGTVMYFQPCEEHKLRNNEGESLEFIFIYTPPGGESPLRENWMRIR